MPAVVRGIDRLKYIKRSFGYSLSSGEYSEQVNLIDPAFRAL